MMILGRLIATVAACCAIAFTSSAVQAQTDTYRVEANSTHTTELTICNPVVEVHLNGDDDTDLDFVIRNSRGQTVHSNYDYSDETRATLYRRSDVQCEDFTVETSNLGNIWNSMDVSLNTLESNSGNPTNTASYRVEANGTHGVDLTICNPQVRIDVRGDGDTDLDFVFRDSYGQVVHSDYDYTDQTSTILYRRSGVECEEFTLETSNLGNVYNLYQVQMEDVVQDPVGAPPRRK